MKSLGVAVVFAVAVAMGACDAVGEDPSDRAVSAGALGVQPLPQERVSWLFDRIAKGERVEPQVLHAALIGPQTALRADAARMLAEWGDASSIPHLIHALTDESSHVGGSYTDPGMATTRFWAARSLRTMTGREFGYKWDDPMDERNVAVLRWTTWYSTLVDDDPRGE